MYDFQIKDNVNIVKKLFADNRAALERTRPWYA